jgi:PAS domain S-box-containing protein
VKKLLRRITRLTPTRVVGLFILLWIGVAVPMAFVQAPRPLIFAYGVATLIYSFFVASWAMLRTAARLRGMLDEGESPDGGLLLESLPQAAVVLDARGRARGLNMTWLDLFGLARNHVAGKPYKFFCDPALRRAIDRARRFGEEVRDIKLSARTPDGRNVFFRADVKPLGAGWLVCATAEERGDPLQGPYYQDDRLYQFGRVGASLLPELADLLTALRRSVPAADVATLEEAIKFTGQLTDLLDSASSKPATITPVKLLQSAAQLAQPAYARRNVVLSLRLRDHLPPIRGQEPHLIYALLVVLLHALEAIEEGGQVVAHARSAGEDVEFMIAGPLEAEGTPDPANLFTPALAGPSAGLAVARQIVREHDGELLFHTSHQAGAHFLIQLPRA